MVKVFDGLVADNAEVVTLIVVVLCFHNLLRIGTHPTVTSDS